MPSDRNEMIADLFHLAAEMPESSRAKFLQERCAGDSAMQAEVMALLAADSEGQNASFLSPPARTPGPFSGGSDTQSGSAKQTWSGVAESLLAAGTQIGRYRILEVLGAG